MNTTTLRCTLVAITLLGALPEAAMTRTTCSTQSATCAPTSTCTPASQPACASTERTAISPTCASSCTPSTAPTCGTTAARSCGQPDFIPFDPAGEAVARTEEGLIDLAPILEPVRAVFRVPGLAAAIVRDGRLDGIGTAGIRRVGSDQRLADDDRFHLGSCGKAITATVAAVLVDRGRIEWDRTIGQAFPELATSAHAAYLDVTLHQLLAHRGGFASRSAAFDEAIADFEGALPEQRARLVAHAVTMPPAQTPGSAFLYSDIGYSVAGAMLERATGTSWEGLVRTYLAEPLGLNTLGFGAPGVSAPQSSPRGHVLTEDGLVALGVGPGADLANPSIGPAGTVHMSLRDWATFARLHLRGHRGEDTPILSREAFAELHRDPFGDGYALGWFLSPSQWGNAAALTHTGSCGAWAAVIWIVPERNAALLVATNYGGGSGARAFQLASERLGEEFLRVE